LVAETGKLLALSSFENGLTNLGGGAYEHDMAALNRSITECASRVLRGARSIDIISITGQSSAPVCLDQKGSVVAPVISHLDNRGSDQLLSLIAKGWKLGYVPAKIFSNLLWIKENYKERYRRIKYVVDIREYIGFLLTGVVSHDETGISSSQIRDVGGQLGLGEQAFGVSHSYATPAGETTRDASTSFRIPSGVPVLVGPGDSFCGLLGIGVDSEGVVADIAGSTEIVAKVVPRTFKLKHSSLFVRPHIVPNSSLLLVAPPLGFIFDWVSGLLYGIGNQRRYAEVEAEVESTEATQMSPVFVPRVVRSEREYLARIQFANLNTNHTRGQLMRAVMEGAAFSVRDTVEEFSRQGTNAKEVRISGGGAQSRVWNQIRTDVLGIGTALVQTHETSCLGAAIVAAVSLNIYRDLSQAEREMVRISKRSQPRRDRKETYDRLYKAYRRYLATTDTALMNER